MDYYHPSLHPMAATTVPAASKDSQDRYHHPTPPYYYYGEDKPVPATAPSASASATPSYHQNAPYQQHMATPSYSFPHSQEQRHHHPPPPTHSHPQQQDSYPLPPRQVQQEFKHHARKSSDMALLVLNNTAPAATAVPPPKQQSSPSSKSQQRQTAAELADFAAHMVCYLLFGHTAKSNSSSSCGSGNNCSSISTHSSPALSRPCSPQTHSGSRQPQSPYSNCPCGVCLQQQQQHQDSLPNSPSRSSCPTSSSNPVVYPSWQQQQQQPQQQPTRSTHRRMLSESEIVQPKPMFRKFCLDVLSATLLSPSVILLSLKYIQLLMANLKSSNKIVNTGEGAEYRFFTGALILANKFLDDNTFTNKTWSDITGMKVKDVNHLEMQFLNGIDFRLFTSPAEYSDWLAGLTQFTGQYMPSQHQVASQQQATAARSPISPVDTTSVDSTPPSSCSVALLGAANGAGAVADSSAGSRPTDLSGSGSMAHFNTHGGYSQAPAPGPSASSSMSLSMASISHYIDSVKHIQNRNRVLQGQPLAPVASYAQQYQHQHQGSLTPFTQSPTGGVYPSFSQQTSPLPQMHRKRSAHIAFEDMSLTDRSPGYESSGGQATRPSVFVRSHKRFSSSSASTALMGTPVYHGSEQDHTFRAGHSPLPPPPPSRQPYQSQYPMDDRSHRPSSSLGSNGSMPFARKQHQRSASGNYYGMEMPEYSAPSSALTPSHLQDPVSVRGSYMLASHGTTGTGHSSTWARSQLHPLEAPQPELSVGRPSSRLSSTASRPQSQQAFYHPVTPPSSYHRHHYQHHPESPPFLDSHSYHHHNDFQDDYHSHRSSTYGHSSYEIDPRLWGPLDSMSLQAITTQAAKRVVAQGKALSSSTNGLHMYYPSTLV